MAVDEAAIAARSRVVPPTRPTVFLNGDPERVIGVGRLLISTFALCAIYLDPTQPANLVTEAYRILSGYVALAVLLLFIPAVVTGRDVYKLAVMAIDIGVCGVLVFITDELESPFLTFFTFTIISAAIRWEWPGTLTTAGILQVILFAIGLPDLSDGDPELNLLIIRSVFCWANVLLLGYFGSYRDRSNNRLRELASWPHPIVQEDDRPWLASSMRHASMTLGANAIVVLWTDRDESLQHAAIWAGGACHFVDLHSGEDALILTAKANVIVEMGAEAAHLPRDVAATLGIPEQALRQAYMCGFETIRFRGCAIVIEPAFRDRDTFLLTQIVASRLALELEQYALVRDYASAVGLKERARIAHDLHDSILQDLTAAVLQIDSTQRHAAAEAPDMMRIRDMLQINQRKIRDLVDGARACSVEGKKLHDVLRLFVEPLGAQWDCTVLLNVTPAGLEVSDGVAAELCLTLSEATANAVRHGGAKHLWIDISRQADALDITIEDDGSCGDGSVPRPASINSRVKALGGTLAVARHLAGLRLRIAVPLEQPAQ
ncbi:MAG TPA: histidine kinase [Sphingomonas sp.]|nr:histidine kinase [Sphingomonas sp.]